MDKKIIINKSLEKWFIAREPMRKVLTKKDFCYICNTVNKDIYEITTDDYDGYYNHYGWIY